MAKKKSQKKDRRGSSKKITRKLSKLRKSSKSKQKSFKFILDDTKILHNSKIAKELNIDVTKPQYFIPGDNPPGYLCVISPDKITIHTARKNSPKDFDFDNIENNPNLLGGHYETKPSITINKFSRVFITSRNSEYEDINDKFGNINKYNPTVSLTYKGKEFIYHKTENKQPHRQTEAQRSRGDYILIHTQGNEYISLGWWMHRFTTNNDRIRFVSQGEAGRSGDMSPYAIGNKYGYCLETLDSIMSYDENWKYIDLKNLKMKNPHYYWYMGYPTWKNILPKFLFFKFNIRHHESYPEGTFKDFKVENIRPLWK